MKKILALLLLLPSLASAALNAATVWEVRTTGATTNGGGFKAGGSGTDWTQQAAAQYAVTDAVTAGTTTITSATANFGTDVVDNVLYIQGGTGAVAADWYAIISRTNATTIVVDRSTGLTTGTGATLNIGGAISTHTVVATEVVSGNTVHVKSGTYPETLTLSTSGGSGKTIQWIGYLSTRGDRPTGTDRPLIDAASTRANCISGGGIENNAFQDFRFSGGTSHNVDFAGGNAYFANVSSTSSGGDGFRVTIGTLTLRASESGSNTGYGISSNAAGSGTLNVAGSYIHDNTAGGIGLNNSIVLLDSVIDSNSGPGIQCRSSSTVRGNTIWGNTGATTDGYITAGGGFHDRAVQATNNIFAENGRYGLNRTTSTVFVIQSESNGYYGNATAATNNVTLSASDVTTDPGFTDAAGGNFAIGTNYKALGFPGLFVGSASTSYRDIGAVQRQESASGGGLMSGRGMRGGISQ